MHPFFPAQIRWACLALALALAGTTRPGIAQSASDWDLVCALEAQEGARQMIRADLPSRTSRLADRVRLRVSINGGAGIPARARRVPAEESVFGIGHVRIEILPRRGTGMIVNLAANGDAVGFPVDLDRDRVMIEARLLGRCTPPRAAFDLWR